MNPSKVIKNLERRMAWLKLKIDGPMNSRSLAYLRAEHSALEHAIRAVKFEAAHRGCQSSTTAAAPKAVGAIAA
jgi:hypothetical protein